MVGKDNVQLSVNSANSEKEMKKLMQNLILTV